MQVRQQPAEPGSARQQGGREVERHAVDEVAQEQPEPQVAVGHERQRRQEVLAELAVRRPRGGQSAASNDRLSISTGRPRSNWML